MNTRPCPRCRALGFTAPARRCVWCDRCNGTGEVPEVVEEVEELIEECEVAEFDIGGEG